MGLVWVALHGLNVLGDLAPLTFVVLGAGAVVATLLGVRWYRPALRWPWLVVCGALMLFLAGGATRVALETFGDLSPRRSLVPDLITLPGYALVAVGLTGIARARRRGRAGDFDAILDGFVAALAALTFAWVFLMNPVLSHEHAPLTVRLLLVAYPPMSVFLVAIAAHVTFSGGRRRTPGYLYLLSGMGLMLVGDIVYMLADARLATLPQSVVDVPYALAYVSFVACVLHPSMRELCEPMGTEDTAPTRARVAFVAMALGIPALVTVTRHDTEPTDRLVLTAIIVVLTVTGIWRVLRAIRAHARAEARLAHQVTHDVLTELPNRVMVEEHVGRVLRRRGIGDRPVALLFLDVDRFKLVNDTHGHSLGDELLVAVAQRLADNVRPGDLVARIGGDEFVIVLDDVADLAHALDIAERVRSCFHDPFMIRDAEIYSSASLGVAFAEGPEPDIDAESLIRDADTAMYQAKAAGRDGVAVFDSSMRQRAAERLWLERDLRHALERGEFHLAFQPIVEFPRGPVRGVEALLRWTHPGLGEIPPATFIPVAEDTGLIGEIGEWVLDEACRHVSGWRRRLDLATDLHLAVNLSARQLRDPALVGTVGAALTTHRLPPSALCLELTESLLMEDRAAASVTLGALRGLGIGLSIDDFGTGYSSLAYLKQLPVDQVKIDQAFIEGLDRDDSSDESLVAAIVAMAGALGMTTVAEGVETPNQEHRLALLGCTLAQGYMYSRPVPPEQVPEALRRLADPQRLVLGQPTRAGTPSGETLSTTSTN